MQRYDREFEMKALRKSVEGLFQTARYIRSPLAPTQGIAV